MSVVNGRFVSKVRTNKRRLLLGTLLPLTLGAIGWGAAGAQSLPSGGAVVSGQASISSTGTGGLSIDQSSQKAIIDWNNFSIGDGKTVQFNNGSGATLNRVTGGQVSSIDGKLSATGSVYLINPNGVIVGQKGVVNVGGTFVGSTLDVSNAQFNQDGAKTFAGSSNAAVVNMGRVGALGGNVVLVAANVSNQGTITAPNGTASLVAGHGVVMQDGESDGNFLIGTGGSNTSVGNTGTIEAASAQLVAEGGNVFALAGNTNGVIRATGVATGGGKLYLTAGDEGTVNIAGSNITASDAKGNGGNISVRGGKIDVAKTATLDASSASATGLGGSVTLIANMDKGSLGFHGKAVARGGAQGGDGGFVETSGAAVNFDGAQIDTSAAAGKTGQWLTDPFDLNVDGAAATTLSSNLATTNVTLQTTASGTSGPGTATSGSGDININNDISWSSANTLTLDAYHSINISGNLTVAGAGKVVFKTNDGGTGGDYGFYNHKSLQYTGTANTGQALTINGNSYVLMYVAADMVANMDKGTSATVGTFAALARSLDFTTITTADLPANRPFLARGTANSYGGTFTGLGNTVSNLTINMTSNLPTAFIGATSAAGTVRDFGLYNTTINYTNANSNQIGSLIGTAAGTIKNVFSENAKITGSTNTGALLGQLATGSTLDNAYVTGSVTNVSRNGGAGNLGGLIGNILTVAANTNPTTISNVYSTASVLVGSPVTASTVGGVGGLIGNASTAQVLVIKNAYETGNVTAAANGNNITNMGGLVGIIGAGTTVTNAWASGAVGPNSTTTNKGQLFGTVTVGSVLTNVSNTSDSSNTIGTVGSGATTGITAQTRAQLQLSNFDPSVWSVSAGLDPYLNRFATRNALVGTALNANGTAAAAATVNVYYSGYLGSTVSTASDGTYSTAYFTPFGVSAAALPGLTLTLNGAGAVSGAVHNDGVAASGLKSGTYTFGTTKTSLSALGTDLTGVFGTALNGVQGSGSLKILAGNGFIIDGAINQAGSVAVQAGGGDITLASTGSVTSAASGDAILLAANGNFLNSNPSASALSATNGRWLVSSLSSLTSTNGALVGKSYYNDAFDFATSSFASTPNSGNRFVYANAPRLTVTADTKSSTYTGAAQTDTYTVTGYLTTADKTADSFTGSVTSLTTSSKNAGAYNITPTGTLVSDENYGISYNAGTFTVDKASLGAALTGTVTKTYDATTVATVSNSNVVISGVIGSDVVTVASGSGTYAGKNVGTGIQVTVSGANLTLGGADGGNYKIVGNASGNIGVINKADLTLVASSDARQYNGTTSSSATPYYDPAEVKGTDTVSGLTQAFDNANASDSRVLSVTGYTITDGNGGGNYNVILRTANGRITTVPLTNLNWSVANGSSTYGTAPVLGAATLTGVLAQDAASVSAVVGLFKGVNQVTVNGTTAAGTYSERVTGLSGSAAGNYNLLSTGNTLGVFIVNPKLLSASLIGSVSKTYDATTLVTLTSGNFSGLTGVVAGDTVTLDASTSGNYDTKNAGTGKAVTVSGVKLAGASAANYTIASNVTGNIGTITPKAITASLAGTVSKVYDGTATASFATGNYALNGLIAGDNLTLTGTGTYNDKNAATGKAVNFTGLGLAGTDAGNYTLGTASLSGTNGTVSKKVLNPSLVGSVTKTFDGAITATLAANNYSLGGLVSGDAVTVASASRTYADKNAGTGKTVTATGLTISGTDAGNYSLASTTATGSVGTINKKVLTGTLVGTLNRSYDGTSTAAVQLANYSVLDGKVGTDDVKIGAVGTANYFDKNQGTGKLVTSGPVTLTGADAGNYTTVSFAGNIGAIFAIPVSVKADDKSKALGDPEPAYTYVVTSGGLLGGDSFTGVPGRGPVDQGEFAGTYKIGQGGLGVTANYVLTFVPGTLTIADALDKHGNVVPAGLSTPTALTNDLLALGTPSGGGDVPTFNKTPTTTETTPCNGNDKACLARVYPSNRDVSNLISFAGQN